MSAARPLRARPRRLSDLFSERAEAARHRSQSGIPLGATTGLADLDALIDPLVPGRAIVIASRPSLGRTTLALQIALQNTRNDYLAVYLSNTLVMHEIAERALALENETGFGEVYNGRLHVQDWGHHSRPVGQPYREMIVVDRVDTLDDLELVVDQTATPHVPAPLVVVDGIDRLVADAADSRSYDRLREATARRSVAWVFKLRLAATRVAGAPDAVNTLLDSVPDHFAGTLILLEPGASRGELVARVVRNASGPTGDVAITRRPGSPRLYGVEAGRSPHEQDHGRRGQRTAIGDHEREQPDP